MAGLACICCRIATAAAVVGHDRGHGHGCGHGEAARAQEHVFPFLFLYFYSNEIFLLAQTQATESRRVEDSRWSPGLRTSTYERPRPVLIASCDSAATLRLMATARRKKATPACRVETSNNVQRRINGAHGTMCPHLSHAIKYARVFRGLSCFVVEVEFDNCNQ